MKKFFSLLLTTFFLGSLFLCQVSNAFEIFVTQKDFDISRGWKRDITGRLKTVASEEIVRADISDEAVRFSDVLKQQLKFGENRFNLYGMIPVLGEFNKDDGYRAENVLFVRKIVDDVAANLNLIRNTYFRALESDYLENKDSFREKMKIEIEEQFREKFGIKKGEETPGDTKNFIEEELIGGGYFLNDFDRDKIIKRYLINNLEEVRKDKKYFNEVVDSVKNNILSKYESEKNINAIAAQLIVATKLGCPEHVKASSKALAKLLFLESEEQLGFYRNELSDSVKRMFAGKIAINFCEYINGNIYSDLFPCNEDDKKVFQPSLQGLIFLLKRKQKNKVYVYHKITKRIESDDLLSSVRKLGLLTRQELFRRRLTKDDPSRFSSLFSGHFDVIYFTPTLRNSMSRGASGECYPFIFHPKNEKDVVSYLVSPNVFVNNMEFRVDFHVDLRKRSRLYMRSSVLLSKYLENVSKYKKMQKNVPPGKVVIFNPYSSSPFYVDKADERCYDPGNKNLFNRSQDLMPRHYLYLPEIIIYKNRIPPEKLIFFDWVDGQ